MPGSSYYLDSVPAWAVFVVTVAICWVAIKGGYLVGRLRVRRDAHEKGDSIAAIHGTILALLTFILAFTFGMASTRYLARHRARTLSFCIPSR